MSDALQRVTGVQVARSAGEVSSVQLRGLPDVETYINGRETFTGTGRGVALADIPAELVAGIDVYKTLNPEQIEGAIAGAVDIRLRRPFDSPASSSQEVRAACTAIRSTSGATSRAASSAIGGKRPVGSSSAF